MIEREMAAELRERFDRYPFVIVTGPRQSGKTTLCRSVFEQPGCGYVSLDALDRRAHAQADPRGFLASLGTPAIIDEVQHVPDLFSYLKELADLDGRNGQYVLTGSENLKLSDKVRESLAGRASQLRLLPLSLAEVRSAGATTSFGDIAYSGFYPRIVAERLEPREVLTDYFEMYVERDVGRMGGVGDLSAFRQFVALCAGRVGTLLDLTSLSDDVGVARSTIRKWLTVLERSYIAFLLPPYFANIRKRLVKSPKLYFYDVGLASYLLGIEHPRQLVTHPLRGPLFENIVIAEALKHCYNRGREPRLSFFRDSRGLECDLLYGRGHGINAIEAKSGATVASEWITRMGRVAATVPAITEQTIAYGGDKAMTWRDVGIVPLDELADALAGFDTGAHPRAPKP
ncbi:ATP-binding protein [Candidatus Poriferisodalis sp.]|uniref:ATP-binding protein n=1 Tax=Candidatus Poriferisodalis sp. TaxID=3101277 RepID=UPI003B01AF16